MDDREASKDGTSLPTAFYILLLHPHHHHQQNERGREREKQQYSAIYRKCRTAVATPVYENTRPVPKHRRTFHFPGALRRATDGDTQNPNLQPSPISRRISSPGAATNRATTADNRRGVSAQHSTVSARVHASKHKELLRQQQAAAVANVPEDTRYLGEATKFAASPETRGPPRSRPP